MKSLLTASLLAVFMATQTTHAAISMTITEVSGNVVFSYSGSLNLTGATFSGSGSGGESLLLGSGTNRIQFVGSPTSDDRYSLISAPQFPLGATPFTSADSTGVGTDTFRLEASGNFVALPLGYSSGTPISGEMTFNSTTIEALQLNPGVYTWTLPSDSISATIVPEPQTTGILLGLATLTAICLRRRK